MDDFNVSSLHESKNEWGSRLLTILTPVIVEGFRSIFEESYKLCKDNNEQSKYLMTFQNLITRIPKWNPAIIEDERSRIVEKSGCHYLEDLITCVHIIQLKTYIHAARKVYKNVYLFETGIAPLQTQKNNREIEILIQESILNAVRESIPVESILRAYMDESVEEDILEEVKEQVTHEKTVAPPLAPSTSDSASIGVVQQSAGGLSFNNSDSVRDVNNVDSTIIAPKDLDTLQKLGEARALAEISGGSDSDGDRIKISMDPIELAGTDVHVLSPPVVELNAQNMLHDIEILS